MESEPEAPYRFEPEPDDEGIGDLGETESADPQHWIDQLVTVLERTEAQLGEDHREALKARMDLASAYRQIGEAGLAAPLAIRNTVHAEQFFPHLAPALRTFQNEVCSQAGYTLSDVRLLAGAETEPDLVVEVVPELVVVPEPEDEPEPVLEEAVVEAETAEVAEDPAVEDAKEPAAVAVPVEDSGLAYEVIRLRFELAEAQRTIERLRRRNAKLLEALADD